MMRWKEELKRSIRDVEELRRPLFLTDAEVSDMQRVSETFPLQITPYYLGLIDSIDPDDPIRNLIVPGPGELDETGSLDTSGEALSTRIRGLQHKYSSTALLLVSGKCACYCRFCFRKRLFEDLEDTGETIEDYKATFQYLEEHTEISNVLVSGGEPLLLSNEKLDWILTRIGKIPHIRSIRIGTKIPAFLPFRITEDKELQAILSKHSQSRRRLYVITHFDHPRELTDEAVASLDSLTRAGVFLCNQTVLLRRINSRRGVLRQLLSELGNVGATPYYVFQCRPVKGSRHSQVPLERGYRLLEEAKRGLSGLGKRFKYIMSHYTGKIEICGVANTDRGKRIYLKYHQARYPEDLGRFFALPLVAGARWLDDLIPAEWSASRAFPRNPSAVGYK